MAATNDLGKVTMKDWEESGRRETFRKSHPETFPFRIFIAIFVAMAVMYGILVVVDAIIYQTSRSRIILESGDRVEAQIDFTRFTHSEDHDRYYVRVNYTYNGMNYHSMPLPTMYQKEYDEYKQLVHGDKVTISVNPEKPSEIYVVIMGYYSIGPLGYGLMFLGMFAFTFLIMLGCYYSWKKDNEAYLNFQVPPSEVRAILREREKQAQESDPDFVRRTEEKKKLSDAIACSAALAVFALAGCVVMTLLANNSRESVLLMLNAQPVQAQVQEVTQNAHAGTYAAKISYTVEGNSVSDLTIELKQAVSAGQTIGVYVDTRTIHKVYETKPQPETIFLIYSGAALLLALLTVLFVCLTIRSSRRYRRL